MLVKVVVAMCAFFSSCWKFSVRLMVLFDTDEIESERVFILISCCLGSLPVVLSAATDDFKVAFFLHRSHLFHRSLISLDLTVCMMNTNRP